MKIIGKDIFLNIAPYGFYKHNQNPVPLFVQSYDISDVRTPGQSCEWKERYVYEDGSVSAFSNIVTITLDYTGCLTTAMVSDTSIYWPRFYKSADHPGINTTKDNFLFYSTDHALSGPTDGGVYFAEFDSITTAGITGFLEHGKLPFANGYQAETPFLLKVPLANNGVWGNEVYRMFFHTAAGDPRNGSGLQETHCYSTAGGDLMNLANWTDRGNPFPLVPANNETHSGYARISEKQGGGYYSFHGIGGSGAFKWAVSTSPDCGVSGWTRIKEFTEIPNGSLYIALDTFTSFLYDGKNYCIALRQLNAFPWNPCYLAIFNVDEDLLPTTEIEQITAFNNTAPGNNYRIDVHPNIVGDTLYIFSKKRENNYTAQDYRLNTYDLTPLKKAPEVRITNTITQYLSLSDINLKVEIQGNLSKLEFYEGANLIGTTTKYPYTFKWNTAPAGSYTITAKAYHTDTNKGTFTSKPLSIVVNAAAFPSANLVAGYKFEELVNTDPVADVTGNHPGVNINGVVQQPGVFGKAYDFVNAADLVEVADHADLQFYNGTEDVPFTVVMKVLWHATGNYTMISKSLDASNYAFRLYCQTNHQMQFLITGGSITTNHIKVQSDYFVKPYEQWLDIWLTYDGSKTAEGMELWIKKKKVGQKSMVGTYTGINKSAGKLRIGGYYTSLYGMKGKVDETYIFKGKVLSENEMSYIANNGF